MTVKKIAAALLAAFLAFSIAGCSKTDNTDKSNECAKDIFAMDTYMSVKAYGENAEKAVDEALKEIKRLHSLLNVRSDSSETGRLNNSGSAKLSQDCAYLWEKAQYIYETTNGSFDITIYPVMQLWGFSDGNPFLPAQKDIDNALLYVGSQRISYSEGTLKLGKGQKIDLGGIAKGYTGDRIMKIFEKNNISSGIISLGGNVQCFRRKPTGELWRCGIADPDNPYDGSYIARVDVEDKAVVTSGGYERFFTDEKTGITYHHIMDPETGSSAQSGLSSVSIVSSDGTLADGLSTACFVMGKDKSLEHWRKHKNEYDMILIEDDGKIFITEGIKDVFASDRSFEIMS